MTATSTITAAWYCPHAHAHEFRDRGGNERGNGRDKPQRNRSEKRVPLKQKIADAEAEIARINGIISKIDTALALPDLFTRDPSRPPSSARRELVRRAHCSGPRKNGWRRVRNMTKRPAEPIQVQECRATIRSRRLFLRFGFLGLRRRHRLRSSLDRTEASRCEGVDSGALPLRIVDDRHPIAARIVGEIDAVRRANPRTTSHSVMTKRHRPVVEAVGAAAAPSVSALASAGPFGGAIPGQSPSALAKSSELTGLLGVRGGVSIETFLMNSLPERENIPHLSTADRTKKDQTCLSSPPSLGRTEATPAGAFGDDSCLAR